MFKESEDGKWYRVSLRLMGDGLPIDEIEDSLGIVATEKNPKGSPHEVTGEKRRTNVWVWSTPHDSDVPFEDQLDHLLAIVEPKKDRLRAIIEMPGVEGELFLGYGSDNGQGGAYLSAETLSRVAECGLSLSLDLYPPSGDDED